MKKTAFKPLDMDPDSIAYTYKQDWLWYKAHPRVIERIRPPYPHERDRYGEADIRVTKVSPWWIVRYPVYSPDWADQ